MALIKKSLWLLGLVGVGLFLWTWWTAYRVGLGVTYSTPPLAEMAIDCRSTDTKTFQQAKRAGLITRDARTEPGYLDQIAVMPAWYDITIEQKRGLVHVASCVLSAGMKGIQVFDARNGREIARWTQQMRHIQLLVTSRE